LYATFFCSQVIHSFCLYLPQRSGDQLLVSLPRSGDFEGAAAFLTSLGFKAKNANDQVMVAKLKDYLVGPSVRAPRTSDGLGAFLEKLKAANPALAKKLDAEKRMKAQKELWVLVFDTKVAQWHGLAADGSRLYQAGIRSIRKDSTFNSTNQYFFVNWPDCEKQRVWLAKDLFRFVASGDLGGFFNPVNARCIRVK
jgi:hypothetical protein